MQPQGMQLGRHGYVVVPADGIVMKKWEDGRMGYQVRFLPGSTESFLFGTAAEYLNTRAGGERWRFFTPGVPPHGWHQTPNMPAYLLEGVRTLSNNIHCNRALILFMSEIQVASGITATWVDISFWNSDPIRSTEEKFFQYVVRTLKRHV
jgi:hypothetical protein